MRQIDRNTTRMFLRERDNGNCICKIEQQKEKKKQTTWLIISRRDPDTNTMTVIARFAYWSKMRPIDLLMKKARRTYPYMENATDKDLLDEARRRNLLNLDGVSDNAIYEEALNRGLIPINDEYIQEPGPPATVPMQENPPEDDCVMIYEDPDQVTLEPAPKKRRGLLSRFRRKKS